MDVATKRYVEIEDPIISRKNSTNVRILTYDRTGIHFFVNTFFATSKSVKSTRGNTFYQLFVTDKSLAHAEPLRKRSDLIYA